jgi:hypothetical protein
MAALCIVEDPATGGMYTKAIAPNARPVFEKVGYVATTPIAGFDDACNFLEIGKPVIGYSHFLLVGSPAFIARQPMPEGWLYGAYVLSDSQFIPTEEVGWVATPRIAVPSLMTGGALQLAYGKPLDYKEVRPWGSPEAPRSVLNRTEIRQTLVPGWDHTAPVLLAYAEHADVLCAMLSRTKWVNLLLLGDQDAGHAMRLDLHGLSPEQVVYTTSTLAWDAADLYLALNPFVAWPWDVIHAISRHLPVAAIKTYTYETLIEDGHVAPISAFDAVRIGNKLAYQANSTDIAQALSAFLAEPVSLHTRIRVASSVLGARSQKQFTTALIRALFSE